MDIANRLELLREEMRKHGIDFYLVPSIDAHNSEYVPECFAYRSWISGFDGSAGEVLITLDHAYLWTDGRYFLQAEAQLDKSLFTVMRQSGFVSEAEKWLSENAQEKVFSVDAKTIGVARAENLVKILENANAKFVLISENLVANVMKLANVTAAIPNNSAYFLENKYTGQSVNDKLRFVRNELKSNHADFIMFNALDEIAWLYNMRGSDIDFNPLAISYAAVSKDNAWLFIDSNKIDEDLLLELKSERVSIIDYNKFSGFLASVKGSVWLDPKTANYWMYNLVSSNKIIFERSPIIMPKACKNKVEQNGARFAHQKDAIAVVKYFAWIYNNWQDGVTEISSAKKLYEFRKQQKNCKGESFATISGFASNGAIIHYRANTHTNKVITDEDLYLLDSGGQYLEGTTDTTRTFHLGTPKAEHIHHYTLVLKGHLALSRAKFPAGTCGEHLDILARMPLYNEQLNYRHGTGHGVGSFLCVHEGPQRISSAPSNVALVEGMILSNEPGVYVDGSYGIRIENLLLVQELTDVGAGYGKFYKFDDLTLLPYCSRLIDTSLLNNEDKAQIKEYYLQIDAKVRPYLNEEEQAWLDGELSLVNKF